MNKSFILGNPRSGTSLLRLMLNANPAIISPPECGFLHWWSFKYHKTDFAEVGNIDLFVEDLKTSKKIETWQLDYNSLKDFLLVNRPKTYSAVAELIYSFYGNYKKHASNIIDKNNYYINHLNDLNAIWPDASYIHLVRDGRDVACSYIDIKSVISDSPYKPKLSDQIEDIATEWNQNNLSISAFINQSSIKGYSLRYEDLISYPEEELSKLCSFLGVKFDPLMLEYYKISSHDEPQATMDWKKKTLTPPDKANIGRHKSILSSEEINTFNVIAEESLKKFRYTN